MIIHKIGCIYYILDLNGPLEIVKPDKSDGKEAGVNWMISYYDKTHKTYYGQEPINKRYVAMFVAEDEAIDHMIYNEEVLTPIRTEAYSVFFGFGHKENKGYQLYDRAGNLLLDSEERNPL